MKGWKLKEPLNIQLEEIEEPQTTAQSTSKVKITKTLLTLADVLRFNGESEINEKKEIVLGSFGIGVISETQPNLFGLEVGKHVYINPNKPCENCYNCKSDQKEKCSNMQIAAEDYDGFLKDFINVDINQLHLLPDTISDINALFINHISLAVSIIDKLHVEKGDYVAIVGANNFGIILSELLIYYQTVPILCTQNEEDKNIAKESGVYYVLGEEDNWVKEVSSITSGRMANKVVYVSDTQISPIKAFQLSSFGARFAYTGNAYKSTAFSLNQAIKKQLNIICMNNDFTNTDVAINLLANNAIDLSHLKLNTSSFDNINETLSFMNNELKEQDKIYETIIELI